MPRRLLDEKLLDKLAKKLSRTSLQIVKLVSARAARKGISSEAALILFAKENGIGAATVLRKLDPNKQMEVRSATQNLIKALPKSASSKRSLRAAVLSPQDDFVDPFLSDALYSGLSGVSSEAYQMLFILENSIRDFIKRILEKKYGSNWWSEIAKTKSTSEIAKKAVDRKKNEADNWWHAKRGAHEIFYIDYADLLKIIRIFDAQFSIYFKKGGEKNLPGKLAELAPTRNVVAHNNPIIKTDLERLRVHSKDWIKYMQYLYQNLAS
jgi:predicted CopG family antitoxin